MDSFTLEKLEFDRIRQILTRFCRCSLGQDLAKRIVPSRRPETVAYWLDQTSEMVTSLRQFGTPPFGGIGDIRPQLARAVPAGGATGDDFATIASTLVGCGNVRQWLLGLSDDNYSMPLLSGMGEKLGNFEGEIRAIEAVVDERGEVRDSASPRLASIRREIENCQRLIREIVYSFVRRGDVSPWLQSTSVQLHEDRYVLPVKSENRGRVPGVVHRSSHTGATVFVEPAECVQLNNRLVGLHDEQRDEISRLLGQLAIRIHSRQEEILWSLRVLAQVDLVAAKAQYAYQFNFQRPDLTETAGLRFFQARHPLLIEQAYQQELAGTATRERLEVVPIDVRLGSDFDLLIVTGSNTGGKTVALKTVGLLALMTQSGLHIPVGRGSSQPIFREILLDVGDEQSLEQSLSTFGAHLKRIQFILHKTDRHSLVLLDELGSGTDPEEGGAIGQAILDELRNTGCMGMVTTHLGVLKAYAYNHERVDNASVEFDTKTLRPTYKLLIGQPGESHALVVAEHLGLPRRVVAAARKHLPRQGRQLRQAIRATTASREASEAALSQAHQAKQQAQTQQEFYESRLAEIDRLGKQFADWISSLPAMKPGDSVYVRRLKRIGTLERLQLSRQIAVVNIDKIQVEVPLQELMPDIGDPQAVEEIISLRRRIAEQARAIEQQHDEAERLRKERQRALTVVQERQKQFEMWLNELGKLSIGDEVTFSRAPWHGKLTELNLPAGKATVETNRGPLELRIQELFPEMLGNAPARRGRSQDSDKEKSDNRPMLRRSADSRAAKSTRQAVLDTPPGQQVYVVPFRRRATLLRIVKEKDVAVVQSGAFEMELPLSDLEPVA